MTENLKIEGPLTTPFDGYVDSMNRIAFVQASLLRVAERADRVRGDEEIDVTTFGAILQSLNDEKEEFIAFINVELEADLRCTKTCPESFVITANPINCSVHRSYRPLRGVTN